MAKPDPKAAPMTLDEVRARIDAIDVELLKLLDERAGMPRLVAAAKAAAGDAQTFGLRPGRETQLIRDLLAKPRANATPTLIVRLWREFIGDSLAQQGPYQLAIWGGKDPARTFELARLRFGTAPPARLIDDPATVIGQARLITGSVGVLALTRDNAWWGRLLAEPKLKVFAALPCLAAWGPMGALAIADVAVEPTGNDRTFWVTDAPGPASAVEEHLSRDGVAATLLAEHGGLKLFVLSGFYQPGDERLARAPGQLSGVIGAAPAPFDV